MRKKFHVSRLTLATALVAACCGCQGNAPSSEQVQQQAAQTAATVKQDAQQAAAATRQAAGVAVQDVNAVASGVQSGIKQNAPAGDARANLNTSTQVRLALLPGVSYSKAGEIIARRPYTKARQLVSRGLLTEEEFAKVAPDVEVRP